MKSSWLFGSFLGASAALLLLGCSGQTEPGSAGAPLGSELQADKSSGSEQGDDDDDDDDDHQGPFTITSAAFAPGSAIPDANTCNGKPFGAGTSPALQWKNAPKHTKSFAIVFQDHSLVDLTPPDNRGYHWVIWDIPKHTTSLPAGLANTEFLSVPATARQWSRYSPYGYLGPCPNFDPTHVAIHTDSYAFTLYALDVKILDYPPPNPAVLNYTRTLHDYLETHSLAKTELTATSAAIPSAPPVPPGPPPAPAPRP
jgi:Raf kinase inhibitor-like YbhB/YbcL family protein